MYKTTLSLVSAVPGNPSSASFVWISDIGLRSSRYYFSSLWQIDSVGHCFTEEFTASPRQRTRSISTSQSRKYAVVGDGFREGGGHNSVSLPTFLLVFAEQKAFVDNSVLAAREAA